MPNPVDAEILDLDRQMAELTGSEPSPMIPEPEAAPVEAEATPVEEAAPEVEPEQVVEAAEPAPEPETDWRAEAELLRRTLAEREKHASRLAGELGYLRGRLKGAPENGAPTADDTQDAQYTERPPTWDEVEALKVQLEETRQRTEQLEREYDAKKPERSAALAAAVFAPVNESLKGVDPDVLQAVVAKHDDEYKYAMAEDVPEVQTYLLRVVAAKVEADGREMQNLRARERAVAQKTASTAALHKAKLSQMPSGSGGVAAPPPRPKGPGDMTAAEADRWLRDNVT